ncbi:MAG: radical SAM protein [Acidobacteriaceae bacterium]|nr:radical SAM protein [Acidobacteriaceae bacterium]
MKSLYLINPASDFPTYYGAESFAGRGLRPAVMSADLTIATVAGMVPEDFFVTLCDESISPIDFNSNADYIGITGKINQRARMIAIAQEFRKRGKVVMIGGPYATLSSAVVRPYCDILVRGEIEEIADDLFSDLKSSCWRDEYVGDKPDLSRAVIPRWDLYPNDRAMIGTLQTSRGCPFQCEFCDVIQYLGRKQRRKPIPQVLAELDVLYRVGYRTIFIADDNFTANRPAVKALLVELRDWNRRQESGGVRFGTQVSIDVARNPELIRMCAEAGLTNIFIGIETPNQESLKETKKNQNLNVDLVDQIQCFLDEGIQIAAGMIAGFDADGPDIFQRQYDFGMAAPVPIITTGALVAPDATPLHARMERANRLFHEGSEGPAMPWSTNIEPQQMTRDQLLSGVQWLCNNLYHPAAFAERVCHFIDRVNPRSLEPTVPVQSNGKARTVDLDSAELVGKFHTLGREEASMLSKIIMKAATKPALKPLIFSTLLQYVQIRYMYERGSFWEYRLAAEPAPAFVGRGTLPVLPQQSPAYS